MAKGEWAGPLWEPRPRLPYCPETALCGSILPSFLLCKHHDKTQGRGILSVHQTGLQEEINGDVLVLVKIRPFFSKRKLIRTLVGRWRALESFSIPGAKALSKRMLSSLWNPRLSMFCSPYHFGKGRVKQKVFLQSGTYPVALISGMDPSCLGQDLMGGFQSVFCGAPGCTRGHQNDKGGRCLG